MNELRCRARGLAVLVLLVGWLPAQSRGELFVRDYQKLRDDELMATGQRHVDLGWSIRNSGLIAQATYQLVRAVELSEGKHQGAAMVLNIVRTYEEAFWHKKRKKPRSGSLRTYEKKAAKLVEHDMKGQIKLARAASKAKLDGRMTEHLLAALRFGAEIDIQPDGKGAKIEGFAIDEEFAQWLLEQTVAVNDGQRRFEPAGKAAPRLPGLIEIRSDRLVLRTDLTAEAALGLHALGSAIWEPLQDRLDGAPVQPLGLFVFQKRADYDAYLKACGHGEVGGAGLCDYGTFQTLVCAEGLAEDDLQALVLHELAHLFFFGSSPVAMPDWYAEGFAESFGGQGSFAWDGKRLTVGAPMRRDRIDAIKAAPLTLGELLAGNAMLLLKTDRERAMRFYAQSWALQRFLLTEDNPWRERFEAFEAKCRGSLPGSQSTVRMGDARLVTKAFSDEFGSDFKAIEQAFAAWLAKL